MPHLTNEDCCGRPVSAVGVICVERILDHSTPSSSPLTSFTGWIGLSVRRRFVMIECGTEFILQERTTKEFGQDGGCVLALLQPHKQLFHVLPEPHFHSPLGLDPTIVFSFSFAPTHICFKLTDTLWLSSFASFMLPDHSASLASNQPYDGLPIAARLVLRVEKSEGGWWNGWWKERDEELVGRWIDLGKSENGGTRGEDIDTTDLPEKVHSPSPVAEISSSSPHSTSSLGRTSSLQTVSKETAKKDLHISTQDVKAPWDNLGCSMQSDGTSWGPGSTPGDWDEGHASEEWHTSHRQAVVLHETETITPIERAETPQSGDQHDEPSHHANGQCHRHSWTFLPRGPISPTPWQHNWPYHKVAHMPEPEHANQFPREEYHHRHTVSQDSCDSASCIESDADDTGTSNEGVEKKNVIECPKPIIEQNIRVDENEEIDGTCAE